MSSKKVKKGSFESVADFRRQIPDSGLSDAEILKVMEEDMQNWQNTLKKQEQEQKLNAMNIANKEKEMELRKEKAHYSDLNNMLLKQELMNMYGVPKLYPLVPVVRRIIPVEQPILRQVVHHNGFIRNSRPVLTPVQRAAVRARSKSKKRAPSKKKSNKKKSGKKR